MADPGQKEVKILETVDDIKGRRNEVLGRYSDFKKKTEERKNELEEAKKYQLFKRDADELENWIHEKIQAISDDSYTDYNNLQSKIQKHQAIEAEVTAHSNTLDNLDTTGKAMIDDNHAKSEEIESRLKELHDLWDKLMNLLKEKGRKLQQALECFQFLREADNVLNWIKLKQEYVESNEFDVVDEKDMDVVEQQQKMFDEFMLEMTHQEEFLLDRFLKLEKARVEHEWRSIIAERLESRKTAAAIEEAIAEQLGVEDTRLMNDLELAGRLHSLQKQYEETQAALERARESEALIFKSRESHRDIARRGSVCFEATAMIQFLNPMYTFSYQELLKLYDLSIQHSDRPVTVKERRSKQRDTPLAFAANSFKAGGIAVQSILERLTWSVYQHTSCALLEMDRCVHRILLATEISDSIGCVHVGEREFLISPPFGADVVRAAGKVPEKRSEELNPINKKEERRAEDVKRPDWMTEETFASLQLLNSHFAWFNDLFSRLNHTESSWRALIESHEPELAPLPDRAEEHLKPLQRCCIVRAVRPDRMMQIGYSFVVKVLGQKYTNDAGLDLTAATAAFGSDTPVVLLFEREASLCEQLAKQAAQAAGQQLLVLRLNDGTAQSERSAKKLLQRAMAENCWTLLLCSATAGEVALRSASFVEASSTPEAPNFRLFVAAEISPNLQRPLLQSSVKFVVDTPTFVRDCALRNWSRVQQETLRSNSRGDWAAALHNLVFLHAALQLRATVLPSGFNRPQDVRQIGYEQFAAGLRILEKEFKEETAPSGSRVGRTINYQTIKNLLQDFVYGGALLDSQDVQTVGAIAEFWLSQNSVRKDFEIPKLKYRIPQAFFGSQSSKQQHLLAQALEHSVPAFNLDCAEGCHLQATEETHIGTEHYVYTRLNLLFDKLPASSSLSHQLFERPPTPTDGPAQCSISPSSQKPCVTDMGVMASGSHAVNRSRKAADLMEICHTTLAKVSQVKPLTQDVVAGRIDKIGGQQQPYNIWLRREAELLLIVVTAVRDCLQELRQVLLDGEAVHLGDSLSYDTCEAADALQQLRIPAKWLRLWGPGAPPAHYPLASFVADLLARQAQLDRALTFGRAKMPSYNLGLLSQPSALLALLAQECYAQSIRQDRTLHVDQLHLVAELTSRDRDHIREPPTEGIFVFGLFLWNCGLEKANWDLSDSPPKMNGYSPMPVLQLTFATQEVKLMNSDPLKVSEVYSCPVYFSRQQRCSNSLFELELKRDGTQASKWALKGVQATLRPY